MPKRKVKGEARKKYELIKLKTGSFPVRTMCRLLDSEISLFPNQISYGPATSLKLCCEYSGADKPVDRCETTKNQRRQFIMRIVLD